MTSEYETRPADRLIALLLRADAILQCLALVAVFMPLSWIVRTHELIGLGPFPSEPIAEYLARSLSAFYAMHGVITWTLAGNVPRYREVIRVWAFSFVGLGVLTIAIDLMAKLPLFWTLSEGPFVIGFGLVIIWLLQRDAERSQRGISSIFRSRQSRSLTLPDCLNTLNTGPDPREIGPCALHGSPPSRWSLRGLGQPAGSFARP